MSERHLLTVGHSDRTLEDFLEVLHSGEVDAVIDVRRLPGSRAYPWFDQDPLAASLQEAGIAYRHEKRLTGRRPRQYDVPPEVNGTWRNQSFHNYADHALSEEFTAGLDAVLSSEFEHPALMCSEAVWWRCHRRIVADHALARGARVEHLMGIGKLTGATLTPGAQQDGERLTYPA